MMSVFIELIEWIDNGIKDDIQPIYYHIFKCKVLELQSKYACQSLKEAGY